MPHVSNRWGGEVQVETIAGVPYRMYRERPHRVEELLQFAHNWGTRPHIVQGERVVTFDDLERAVTAKAAALAGLGVHHGDRILLLGWNSPEWIINFWACLAVGATPVLANGWWSEAELAEAISAVKPAMTLADKAGAAKLPSSASRGPWDVPMGDVPDTAYRPAIFQDENDPAVIIFTSGTSGRPKAVVLSHRSVLAGLQMLLHVTKRLPHQLEAHVPDVALHTGPLFHMGGVQTLLRAVVLGNLLVMPSRKFDPGEALELIERWKINRWAAVPTMATRLIEHPDVHRRDLRSLRSLTLGGAPVHAQLQERIRNGLGDVRPRMATGYGLTENGGQATAASDTDTAARPGSSGRPLPCVEIKIDPRPGLPDGEILIRAPTQMTGYFAESESPIDENGWLRTGDLGRLDADGHLWITGRCKDLIIRGGENIAPAAVERALVAVPGVADAAVFGLPHPEMGEEVAAVIVIEKDCDPDLVKAQLRSSLASFAIPTRWHFQTEPLPVNHVGKVDKAAVIAQLRAEGVAG